MRPLVGYNTNNFQLKQVVLRAMRELRRKEGVIGVYRQYVTLPVVNKLIKPRTQVHGSAGLAGVGESVHKVAV